MNPFLRYLADKNSARTHTHTHTHTHTDRHTPMTTRPCGLRRAGNNCVNLGLNNKTCENVTKLKNAAAEG